MPNVIDVQGTVVRDVPVPAALEKLDAPNLHVVYRAVHREMANARAGTASTKKRDEVSGGGRKPWRQKGTGRARQGSVRSPQWRHGGVVFGPVPRSFVESLNKKERRAAFLGALADRFNAGAVTVLDTTGFALIKTAEFAKLFFGGTKEARKGPRTLVVVGSGESVAPALLRAGGNLSRVSFTHDGALDVKDVLRFERLVFTTSAYEALSQRLGVKGGNE